MRGPLLTDEARVIRRIGYAVWRYCTKANILEEPARYVDDYWVLGRRDRGAVATNDWAWYEGEGGYSTLQECLKQAILDFREDLYVETDPNRVNDPEAKYASVTTRYASDHGINMATAVTSVLTALVNAGVVKGNDQDDAWVLDVDNLDAWVAACLLQLPSREERIP